MCSLNAAQFEPHERPILPRAVLVDGLGDQFLAGASFALDQHGGVGRCDAVEPFDDVAHRRAVADHALEAKFFVEPTIQFRVRPPQVLGAGGVVDHAPQLLQVERLEQDS